MISLQLLFTDVVNEQLMHKLVTVDAADKSAGIIVVCDIRRVLRQNIAHELIYGVVALDFKRVLHGRQYFSHLCLAVNSGKFSCNVFHGNIPP